MWCRRLLIVVGTAALSVGLISPAAPATPVTTANASASASRVSAGAVPGAFPGVEVTPVSSPGVGEIAVGSGPVGVALSTDGGTAMVSNMFAGTVSRVRTSDGVVTATVVVGRSPTGVAISGDGSFAYVVNRDSNTVSRIRMSDATVTATIPVGTTPFWVAISPDGSFAYVTNVDSNTVTRIRTSDDAVTATIPVGTNPYPVAMSPDGSFAYVGNFSTDTVSRIRTSDGVVTSTIPVGSGPVGIAFAPNSSFAYVTNQTGGTVSRIRTSDGAVTATIPVGTTPVAVAITLDSATALVTNYASASVSRIATASNTVAATFAVGIRPYGVAYAPSGAFAYVANFYFDNLWRIEAPQRPRLPTAQAGSQKATVTVTPPAGGSAPTSYRVTSNPGARICTATAPALSCDVTGLTPEISYTFTATATNGAGTSTHSLPSAPVTPLPPSAGAPTLVSVTPGDGWLRAEFVAPVDTGGTPVTGYQYTIDGGLTWTSPTVTGTPVTIVGLNNGQTYLVAIRAVTMAGPGAASGAVAAIPRTVPGPPAAVSAAGEDRRAQVSWKAPSSDGGSRITRYVVTAAPGGASCVTDGVLTCQVSGLINKVAYTFTVVAQNAAGAGLASAPSGPATPSTVPGVAVGVRASAGFEAATVTWSAPRDDGGTPVTRYEVRPVGGGPACVTTVRRTCVVRGLPGSRGYRFTVMAFNSRGASPWSAPSNGVWVRWVPRPPVLFGRPDVFTSWRGRLVPFAPKFHNVPGTRITKVRLVAASGGQVVANAHSIALRPGSFRITQYVWYTMSNGHSGVATNSQRITINRYDPPPPVDWLRPGRHYYLNQSNDPGNVLVVDTAGTEVRTARVQYRGYGSKLCSVGRFDGHAVTGQRAIVSAVVNLAESNWYAISATDGYLNFPGYARVDYWTANQSMSGYFADVDGLPAQCRRAFP